MRKTDELTPQEKANALLSAVERPPEVHELGGDKYYTCFWAHCGENLYRWYDYCPHCGQKIDWRGL